MRTICLKTAYNGTDFCGWQVQPNQRSVQGEIEKALSTIHKKKIRITGAGRTDAGVHALGQYAHFKTEKESIPAEKIRDALNYYLPNDIQILSSFQVDDNFHARYWAVSRIYHYYLLEKELITPFNHQQALIQKKRPSLSQINDLLRPLIGRHDFTSFSAENDPSEDKTRHIYSASSFMEPPYICIQVEGSSFLWKMVRTIIGTILHFIEKEKSPSDMQSLLESKNRKLAADTAPPTGLFLHNVRYSWKFPGKNPQERVQESLPWPY